MKYLDEFRDPEVANRLVDAIRHEVSQPWVLMEICGGQTHSILRHAIDQLLPEEIELVHGPGCPVCVTPIGKIDLAIQLALTPGHVVCSFGDMMRVPGTSIDLLTARAQGGEVRTVYSPLDALRMAMKDPDRQYTFFAVGFETTAPANALTLLNASAASVTNFTLLTAHVCVPPAMEAILSSPECRVQGFLAAGHVCAVMGALEYPSISDRYKVPIVVTGFEPVDILAGILQCVRQLEQGQHRVENAYARAVQNEGNPRARAAMQSVFEPVDQEWRGIGVIPGSGLAIRDGFSHLDAERRFFLRSIPQADNASCQAARVLQGLIKPNECPAFGSKCTPEQPLGAPMVSSEGACAAYYRYRHRQEASV